MILEASGLTVLRGGVQVLDIPALALPAGQVSVRRPGDGRELFVGAYPVRDVPVGEPFELETGQAAKVFVQQRVVSDLEVGSGDHKRQVIALEVTAFNRKTGPAVVEIRHAGGFLQGFKVEAESLPHGSKGGDPVWRLPLAAGAEQTLSFRIKASTGRSSPYSSGSARLPRPGAGARPDRRPWSRAAGSRPRP